MLKKAPRNAAFTACVLLATACSSAEPDPGAAVERAVAEIEGGHPTLADASALGLRNAMQPMEGLVTGGQPSEVQLSGLVEAGFSSFISLRPASEDGAGWEEGGVAGGATFARLPIRGGADLTRENVEALDALLRAAGEDTVLYCASGNRVGALLALRAAWLQEMPAEEALALGRAAGMTRLEPVVMELLGLEP